MPEKTIPSQGRQIGNFFKMKFYTFYIYVVFFTTDNYLITPLTTNTLFQSKLYSPL